MDLLKETIDDIQNTVNNIMTFSRSSIKNEPENVNMEKLINSVCMMIEYMPTIKNRVSIHKIIKSDKKVFAVPSELKASL